MSLGIPSLRRAYSERAIVAISAQWAASALLPTASTIVSIVLVAFIFTGSLLHANEPQPQDATRAILAAFDRYQLVGIGAAHGYKDLDDFTASLIRDPAFPNKVNDIVVECGNRMYQDVLDRFIAGEDIPASQIRPVWGNTTQQMCSLSGFYERLFPLVREINQTLPPLKRLRIVATDPPIDWSKVPDQSTWRSFVNERASSATSVIMTEVVAKKRKALLLFGQSHFTHRGQSSSVAEIEKTHPGIAFAIFTHRGFGNFNSLDIHSDRLEERMKSWPIQSLVTIKDTWLEDLDLLYYVEIRIRSDQETEITDLADAYLYLGPRKSLIAEPIPDDILNDQPYLDELNKRPWAFRQVDPTKKAEANRPLYVPMQDRQVPDARLPLAKFVGIYTTASKTMSVDIDIHKDTLVAKLLAFPKGVALTPAGENRFRAGTSIRMDFDVANSKVSGLTLNETDNSGNVKITKLQSAQTDPRQ